MRFPYIFSQGLRLLRSSRLQTTLLALCYASGILIPMAILAYRQGAVDSLNSPPPAHEYNISPISLSEEVFQKLTDYNEIEEMLLSVGEGTHLAFTSADGEETAVMLDGHILRGSVRWRLPADSAGNVYDLIAEKYSYIGRCLSPDAPYDIMIGDKLLRGLGNPAAFIGKEMMLYGKKYTVCGILQGASTIEGSILSRSHAKIPMIQFRVPEKSGEVYMRLSRELENRLGIVGLLEPKTSDSYVIEVERSISRMFIVALFGFGFCILNSFGIINSFLLDNSKKVYVKLTLGASRMDIFTELMIFWSLIVSAGSLLAFGTFFGARAYMSLFFYYRATLGWQVAMLLPLAGLATAALASLYSVGGIARRLR